MYKQLTLLLTYLSNTTSVLGGGSRQNLYFTLCVYFTNSAPTRVPPRVLTTDRTKQVLRSGTFPFPPTEERKALSQPGVYSRSSKIYSPELHVRSAGGSQIDQEVHRSQGRYGSRVTRNQSVTKTGKVRYLCWGYLSQSGPLVHVPVYYPHSRKVE